jgi:NADP-dependent 3-hydroxy acid dehydrogenase YdfG
VELIALLTGFKRGIGFEICRQSSDKSIHLIASAGNDNKSAAAFEKLQDHNRQVSPVTMDVSGTSSNEAERTTLRNEFAGPGILVNNTGMLPKQYIELTVRTDSVK